MPPAQVMICDDSAVIRAAITNILAADPLIEVVARVPNGRAALDVVKTQPVDVIVLDIEMPVMDGLTALPLLLAARPGVSVIVASALTTRGAEVTMRALRLGAADYLPKPTTNGFAANRQFGPELIAKVLGLARMRRARPTGTPTHGLEGPLRLRPPPARPPALLAIGSSTGGPAALFALIESLDRQLRVPVVVTQHMPATFTPILAQHIDRLGVLPCIEAQDGAPILPGSILLAPGDRHLLVQRSGTALRARLSTEPPENFCRPSVDPMLRSASAALDGRVLVAMLTGMGHDGLAGARQVVEAGGAVVVQDEATSVVWGMPGAVARAGLAHAVLPLQQIGPRVLALLAQPPTGADGGRAGSHGGAEPTR
jgi:two-component system chemotaxis response regulator CheB